MRIERRSTERAWLDQHAVVYIGDCRLACRTLDIGTGGMALLSRTWLPRGRFMRINVSLPWRLGWIDADAILVREERLHGASILGVRFFEPKAPLTDAISSYVSRRSEAVAVSLGA